MLLTDGWDLCVIFVAINALKFCKATRYSAGLSKGVCWCVRLWMWPHRLSITMTLVLCAVAKLNFAEACSLNIVLKRGDLVKHIPAWKGRALAFNEKQEQLFSSLPEVKSCEELIFNIYPWYLRDKEILKQVWFCYYHKDKIYWKEHVLDFFS